MEYNISLFHPHFFIRLQLVKSYVFRFYSVVFCLVYVFPDSSYGYVYEVLSFIDQLLCSYKHVIILGNFNAPDVCWDTSVLNLCLSSASVILCFIMISVNWWIFPRILLVMLDLVMLCMFLL